MNALQLCMFRVLTLLGWFLRVCQRLRRKRKMRRRSIEAATKTDVQEIWAAVSGGSVAEDITVADGVLYRYGTEIISTVATRLTGPLSAVTSHRWCPLYPFRRVSTAMFHLLTFVTSILLLPVMVIVFDGKDVVIARQSVVVCVMSPECRVF